MDGEPVAEQEYTVEVEEAELSSEDERAQSPDNSGAEQSQISADRRGRSDPSPVQDDDDDDDDVIIEEDDDEDVGRSEPLPVTNGSRPYDGESSSRSSAADNRDRSSDDEVARATERSYGKQISSPELSNDDAPSDRDHSPRRLRRSGKNDDADSDYNHSDDADASDDSEDLSDEELKNKPGGRSANSSRLVIPDDMRDDDELFRRSRRTRNPPNRLAASPDASDSSEGRADSDSEYEAQDGKLYTANAAYLVLCARPAMSFTDIFFLFLTCRS